MKKVFLALALLSPTIAACTTALPDRNVDENFVYDGFHWQGGGGIYVSMKTFNDSGKAALCGVHAQDHPSDPRGRFNDLALSSMYVTLGGETITTNIGFFNPVAFKTDTVPLGVAACRRTNVDWQPKFTAAQPDAVFGKIKVQDPRLMSVRQSMLMSTRIWLARR